MKKKSFFLFLLGLVILTYTVTHIIVSKKINNWIEQNENITVENTNINLLLGNVSLDGVRIDDKSFTTDTCIINTIQIKDLSILDYLLKDEINIEEITIKNADLFLTKIPQIRIIRIFIFLNLL